MITEIRSVDLGGSMLAIAIDKGSKMGPQRNFEAWCKGVNDKKWGVILYF